MHRWSKKMSKKSSYKQEVRELLFWVVYLDVFFAFLGGLAYIEYIIYMPQDSVQEPIISIEKPITYEMIKCSQIHGVLNSSIENRTYDELCVLDEHDFDWDSTLQTEGAELITETCYDDGYCRAYKTSKYKIKRVYTIVDCMEEICRPICDGRCLGNETSICQYEPARCEMELEPPTLDFYLEDGRIFVENKYNSTIYFTLRTWTTWNRWY
jgi:hypothetical protein